MKETLITRREKIVNLAQCPPAVRMLYIVHGRAPEEDESEGWTRVYPVLAVQTVDCDTYMKRGIVLNMPFAHEEAEADGWTYTGREQRSGVVVVDDEYGVVSTNDSLMNPTAYEVTDFVLLTGPPDEAKESEAISACIARMKKRLAHNFNELKKTNERKTK